MKLKLNENGLIPAIIQNIDTKEVLMLGYMNQASYEKTLALKKVTFYSRSKQRLWTKGEESGNFLNVIKIENDCDQDTLLIQVIPTGPTCHKGTTTCWGNKKETQFAVITELETTIQNRIKEKDTASYVASLFEKGIHKIAQKVGEEAVEVVIEAMRNNDELFLEESADLLFHYLLLLQAKNFKINDVINVLKGRKRVE